MKFTISEIIDLEENHIELLKEIYLKGGDYVPKKSDSPFSNLFYLMRYDLVDMNPKHIDFMNSDDEIKYCVTEVGKNAIKQVFFEEIDNSNRKERVDEIFQTWKRNHSKEINLINNE